MTSTPNDPLSPPTQSPPGQIDQPGKQSVLSLRRTTLPRSTRAWSRAIVWSLIGLTTFSTLYGFTAKIDSSITALGSVRPVGGDTEVTPTFNTYVEKILVKEGDVVVAGQVLAQLRDTAFTLQLEQTKELKRLARQEYDKLIALLNIAGSDDQPLTLDPLALEASERELLLRQKAAQDQLTRANIAFRQQLSDTDSLEKRLAINSDILQRMITLRSQGAVSQLELDRLRERHHELNATVNRARLELDSAKVRIHEHQIKLNHLLAADREQAFDQLRAVRQQLVELEAKELDLSDRIALSSLRSPVDGIVAKISSNDGEFASASTPVMSIVPQHEVNVDLKVTNSDIGFLRLGQPVVVRVDSFPFTDYGSIQGVIQSISPDALEPNATTPVPYYPVSVALKTDYLQKNGVKYSLRPGMSVTSLVSLGEKPLVSLLIDRFSNLFESAKTIR